MTLSLGDNKLVIRQKKGGVRVAAKAKPLKALVWVKGVAVLVNSGRKVARVIPWAKAFYRASSQAHWLLNGENCALDQLLSLGDFLLVDDPEASFSSQKASSLYNSAFVGFGTTVVEVENGIDFGATNKTVYQLRQAARKQGLIIPDNATPTIRGEIVDLDTVPARQAFVYFLDLNQLRQEKPPSKKQLRLPKSSRWR